MAALYAMSSLLKHFHETWTHAALIRTRAGGLGYPHRSLSCLYRLHIMLGEVQQAAQGHPILGKESSFKMVYQWWGEKRGNGSVDGKEKGGLG